jgi:cytoskeletal protein RodZ
MDQNFTETLGQYLRREREARSVSLEEISRGTRISQPYLEALERDDFHFFSKREYILGFLKGYARHLGLDPEEVLKRYRIQSELTSRKETFEQLPLFLTSAPMVEEISESEKVPTSPPAKDRKRSRRGILIQLAILLAAVSLTLYFQHLLKQAENAEKSPVAGRKAPSEKEVILDIKASGETQSIPLEDQEGPRERSKATNSAKNASAGKAGKAGEEEETVKTRHRPASP